LAWGDKVKRLIYIFITIVVNNSTQTGISKESWAFRLVPAQGEMAAIKLRQLAGLLSSPISGDRHQVVIPAKTILENTRHDVHLD
jgi:hypothetical protein